MSALAREVGKASRTRAAILASAERLFAERGYTDTRLEDVADAVGVKRAALFYHFRDKQALHDAVLEDVFAPLVTQVEAALTRRGSLGSRIESAVEAWVDFVAARPASARLILRHAADAQPHASRPLFPDAQRLVDLGYRLFDEGRRRRQIRPVHRDPFHLASAIIGATVFFVAALASMVPTRGFDPLAPAELAAHKRDAVRTARRLLGIGVPAALARGKR